MGQKRPVSVVRFVTQDTIEEKMMLHRSSVAKKATAATGSAATGASVGGATAAGDTGAALETPQQTLDRIRTADNARADGSFCADGKKTT